MLNRYQMMVNRYQNHILAMLNRLYFIYLLIFLLSPLQLFAKIEAQQDWYCICYSELNAQNQAIPVTSCRSDYEQCIKLADKITQQGSKVIVKGSAISGCAEIKGPFPWSNLTESKEIDWLESKLKGAAWTPKACFLDEQMRKQNPITNTQIFVLNQEIDQALAQNDLNWLKTEISVNKQKVYQSYQQLVQKKEIGQYQVDQQYFQVNDSRIIENNYTKIEEKLLSDYYDSFSNTCMFAPQSTNQTLKMKRIGWLELGKSYYITSSKGVSQHKVKDLSYEIQVEDECEGSYLYSKYTLENQEPNQCSIISNFPLKYPIIRDIKRLDLQKESATVMKIRTLVEKNIRKALSTLDFSQNRLNLISIHQFYDTKNYQNIYEINPNQFYLIIEINISDDHNYISDSHYFIFNADLNQQKLSLLNDFHESVSISINCQIDRDQDGKAEIPVMFSGGEWRFERIIIDDQMIESKN